MYDLLIWLGLVLTVGTPAYVIWQQHRKIQSLSAELARNGPLPDPPHLRDVRPIAGAGEALQHPPSDLQVTLHELRRLAPAKPYRYPLGWRVVGGAPSLALGWLVGDTNHILLTGQSDSGKDSWAFVGLLALAAQHSPEQLQLAFVDGKGLDWEPWRNKAHTWRLAADMEEIKPAMEALTAERLRRVGILRAAGVVKWDEYQGGDLPLLVVYVSELALLQSATSGRELENWLNTELTSARALGIRYILSSQTVSNMSTRWRSQINVFVAGFQPRADQDEPNISITAKEIESRGAVAPSNLPAPSAGAQGVFCVVFETSAINVRAPYLNTQERRAWLARLPDRARVEPAAPAEPVPDSSLLRRFLEGKGTGSTGTEPVLADTSAIEPEQKKIRQWAAEGWSKNRIAAQLGGNRARALERIRTALTEEASMVN